MRNLLLASAGLLLPLGALHAQSLSLGDAMRRADSAAYANRIAVGEAGARSGQATAALQGILPTLRVEGGFTRTDDPLGAFGFLLRQRAVTAASFDPARLNSPLALNNWSSGLVAEVPLVNVDAWYARGASQAARDAGKVMSGWIREASRVDVVRSYYGAVLAGEQVRALEQASAAAHGHLKQAESMVANGLATRSDALLAGVQAGQLDADLIAARNNAALSRKRLALLLGTPGDTAFLLPDSLPGAVRIRAFVAGANAAESGERLDLRATRHQLIAAERDARRATARFLPRVNAFGRYDWNAPSSLFGGDQSFTIGLMASWTPFAGAGVLGDRQAARARVDIARARLEAAEAAAALEREATARNVEVALARMAISENAVRQAEEAHRIVARKYSGGLATVAELLGASATETATRMGLADARFQAIVAEADRRQATGGDLLALSALEE